MLTRSQYLIKEQVSFLKLSDTYDIYDPSSGNKIGYATENISVIFKLLRLLVNKMLLPTRVDVLNDNEKIVFSIKKGPQIFRAKVDVLDGDGNQVGYFQSKLFSFGGAFNVFDTQDRQVAAVKGDWKGWNFKFIGNNSTEIGTVTKKWAGLGKELFTSADNYMISINDAEPNPAKSMLLLAAGLAIDIVYKEKK